MENEEVNQKIEMEKMEQSDSYKSLSSEQKKALVQEQVEGMGLQNLVSFNFYNIEDQFPNSLASFKTYIEEKTKVKADEDIVTAVLCYSAAESLFGFFDKNEVFVEITGVSDNFYYYISGKGKNGPFETRSKATTAGFTAAFEILEEILK